MSSSGRKRPPAPRKPRKRTIFPPFTRWDLGLVLLPIALYAMTLGYGYVLDDDLVTRRNAYVQQGIAGLPEIFTTNFTHGFNGTVDRVYRPLTLGSLAIEVDRFGNRPGVHHLVNVLLYALTVLVLFRWLGALFGREHPWLPRVAALLFAVHPLHTEVVANIKSRDELLALLLGLGSLALLVAALRQGGRRWWIGSAACFLLATLAKETAFALVLLLPLTAFVLPDRRSRRDLFRTAALGILVAGASLALRWLALRGLEGGPGEVPDLINNTLYGASGPGERLATNFGIMARYLRLLVVPYPLVHDYSYAAVPLIGWNHPLAWTGLTATVGSLAAAVWSLRRRSPAGFGVFVYWGFLGLVANFLFLVGATMAERFLYAPSVGFAILAGAAIPALGRAVAGDRIPVTARAALLGVLVVAGSVGTLVRARDWRDAGALFASGVAASPNSARVLVHQGSWLRMQGETEVDPRRRNDLLRGALEEYDAALAIYPEFVEARYNRGVTFTLLGDREAAREAYLGVLEIQPEHTDALNNLGVFAFEDRDYPRAREYFQRSLAGNPRNPQAYANLAATFYNEGRSAEAMATYERGLADNPGDPGLLRNAILVAERMGDAARAQRFRIQLDAPGRP